MSAATKCETSTRLWTKTECQDEDDDEDEPKLEIVDEMVKVENDEGEHDAENQVIFSDVKSCLGDLSNNLFKDKPF